ncbi:MAG: hypothetical protein HN509_14420 [Halobacteriovoraceae bacterium]|jgi:hypothetical protein|nr:hypothetical protein [Halobacteriovoraceae bacterium]MBT5093566.1 hypothetical protein [Halobacteriovoraceae bacterium]
MKKLIIAACLLLPLLASAQPHRPGRGQTQMTLNQLTTQADRLERIVNRRVLRLPVTRAARRFNRVVGRLAMCGQRIGGGPRPMPRPFPRFGRGLPARCQPVLQRARQAFREVRLHLAGAFNFPRIQNLLQNIRRNLRSLKVGGGPVPHRRVQCTAVRQGRMGQRSFLGTLSFSRVSAEQSALRACELAARGPRHRGACFISTCRNF